MISSEDDNRVPGKHGLYNGDDMEPSYCVLKSEVRAEYLCQVIYIYELSKLSLALSGTLVIQRSLIQTADQW
jgi:hypothetical protein